MEALIELAVAVAEKDKAGKDIKPVVKKALEKKREEQEEASSNDIVFLLRQMEGFKRSYRKEIKQLKAKINKMVKEMNDLDRRWSYGEKTANFLPVLRFFNLISPDALGDPDEFDSLTSVPDDFDPNAPAEDEKGE